MKSIAEFLFKLTRINRFFKRILFRYRFGGIGKNSIFDPDGVYINPQNIFIGTDVFIGDFAYFSSPQGIEIGDHVMLGPSVMILGGDHNIAVVGKRMCEVHSGGINRRVVIEQDVWIGARSIILKGVTISEGCVIGAGSVITKNIPPYVIAAGNPCRPLRPRFSEELMAEHIHKVNSCYQLKEIISGWQRCFFKD